MSSILVFYIIFMIVLILLPIIISIATGKVRIVSFVSILIGIGLGIYIIVSAAYRYDNQRKDLKSLRTLRKRSFIFTFDICKPGMKYSKAKSRKIEKEILYNEQN